MPGPAAPPPRDPPAVHAPAPLVAAASDIYPITPRERELCDRASTTDWLYFGSLVVLDVGAIYVQSLTKYEPSPAVRLMGPGAVGLTWGATIGGAYLALPKCEPHWVAASPREGNVRASWPVALSLAMLAGATAPIVSAIATGFTVPQDWTTLERSGRVVLSAGLGFFGALLPYVIPPRTWAAANELEKLRASVTREGAFVTYRLRF